MGHRLEQFVFQDFGWWKYEFCYGKYIIQYHIEKDGSKTVINLGNFIKTAHLEWLQNNPHKRPEPLSVRKHVSHFYTGGTICGKTGKPRHTEVNNLEYLCRKKYNYPALVNHNRC